MGDTLFPIPDDLPYDVAALTEPLAVALHGVNRAEAKPGDKVVVFGCGPIGLGMVLWLVERGVTDVVALDVAPERLERARALGARAALDPTREDLRARLLELHGKAPCSIATPSVRMPSSTRPAHRTSCPTWCGWRSTSRAWW